MQVMKIKYGLAAAALAIALAAISGCGGGSGTQAGGGIGGSGITVAAAGTVSNFGSIIVNDVEYATSDAEVVIERESKGRGDAAVTSHLSIGMVVRVEGQRDANGTSTAGRVVYNDNVEGPVESVTLLDTAVVELVVMGQTVRVDANTVFQNTSIDAIEAGNVLEVSGLVDETGVILASYARKTADSFDPASPVELKGVVQNLNPPARTFTINALTVDYSSAALSGFSGADPLPGRLVEVNGRLVGPRTLLATHVFVERELGQDDAESAEIEGFVTRFGSAAQFHVGTIEVTTDAATALEGLTLDDILSDARIIARGPLTNGIIRADEIRFPERIRLESNVDAVDAGSGLITLQALAPIGVQINSSTKVLGAPGRRTIQPGDHVKVFARLDAQNEIVAAKILVKPASDRAALKGVVEIKAAPATLVVLGVTIDTSSIPTGGFLGKGGRPLTAAEFFAAVQEGDTVTVTGTLGGSTIAWSAIAID
jgi:hypothetical protein